jgi:hypothetical protein
MVLMFILIPFVVKHVVAPLALVAIGFGLGRIKNQAKLAAAATVVSNVENAVNGVVSTVKADATNIAATAATDAGKVGAAIITDSAKL